ncbi:MAG TPA: hypothetical protein VLM83_03950 [Anaerolineales bacterium]|nr:hypothetical protein [Anaerolineales bacterium]
MNLLEKISRFLSPRRNTAQRYSMIYVKCKRCGEKISGRVDLWNELSPDYEDGTMSYHCRKVLMGSGTCFQKIEVVLRFDANRRLVDQEVAGGEAIEQEEFEADE